MSNAEVKTTPHATAWYGARAMRSSLERPAQKRTSVVGIPKPTATPSNVSTPTATAKLPNPAGPRARLASEFVETESRSAEAGATNAHRYWRYVSAAGRLPRGSPIQADVINVGGWAAELSKAQLGSQ